MIAFEKVGAGRPVVFLHSGLADRQMWLPQLPEVARQFTCFAIDLPGYGESPSPTEPFSYPDEISQFIKREIGMPAALVGSSFGGSQAFFTALTAPQWTGPMVLAGSAVMRPEPASERLETVWSEADAAWERGERDRANEIEIEGWVDGQDRPGGKASAEVRDYFSRVNRTIWERHSAQPLPEQLPRPEVAPARIEQPVLLIDGPYDFSDIRQSNQTLLPLLPKGEYVSIADTAHFPSYEKPDMFNEIILEFLQRTWGDRA